MNYNHHYNKLITRSKSRITNEYTEKHHIIPKCMGGDDNLNNIAYLTPEEHYVAHQLLVKIYNHDRRLIYAANMMCTQSKCNNNKRSNNKLYGWLRRRLSEAAKTRTGDQNSSFGKPWYHNPKTIESGKFVPGTEPIGWVKGRFPKKTNKCLVCQLPTSTKLQRWCDICRTDLRKITVFKSEKLKKEYTEQEKINALKSNDLNIRRALFSLGLNDSGAHYRVMKKLKASIAQME